jgi:hypothetical protein
MTKRFKPLKYSIVDTATGLEWQRVHVGPMSWQEARAADAAAI